MTNIPFIHVDEIAEQFREPLTAKPIKAPAAVVTLDDAYYTEFAAIIEALAEAR